MFFGNFLSFDTKQPPFRLLLKIPQTSEVGHMIAVSCWIFVDLRLREWTERIEI